MYTENKPKTKKNMKKKILFLLLVCLAVASCAKAQQVKATKQKVILKDSIVNGNEDKLQVMFSPASDKKSVWAWWVSPQYDQHTIYTAIINGEKIRLSLFHNTYLIDATNAITFQLCIQTGSTVLTSALYQVFWLNRK